MDDETGTLGKLKAAIAKAELVDMSSVKVGDIIYVSLNEEDGLILKDGYDSRRKYIVVIGFTPEGVAYRSLADKLKNRFFQKNRGAAKLPISLIGVQLSQHS